MNAFGPMFSSRCKYVQTNLFSSSNELLWYFQSMNTPTKRFRHAHAIGSLDSDSEELDIEVSATSTPGRISITHQGYPSKRLKTQPAEDQIFTTTLPGSDGQNRMYERSNPVEEKKRNQV
jgi:hypothetical protein